MKYIRTKCGKIVKHPHPNAEVFTFRYEIEKQADTIEELLDGVIVIRKEDDFIMLFTDQHIEQALSKFKNKTNKYEIYGAIWTNKGLIYVAKMNEKGELELL